MGGQEVTGAALGNAYVPGYGMGIVFDEPTHPAFLTIQTHDGSKHFVNRNRVQWRAKGKKVSA